MRNVTTTRHTRKPSEESFESLHASEQRDNERVFRQMIDALPAAIYTTDASGKLTHYNPACVELSGRTPELGSDHWCVTWKLFYPDGRPMPHDECPMAIALKEGRIIRGAEAIAERPDGTRVWFTPYPTPLFDDAGHITGGINMLVDITERKQAEQTLRESEERFRALFAAAPMAVFVCDTNAVIQHYNDRAVELWGREPECGVEQHCGSVKLWLPDGTLLPHVQSPVVGVLRTGVPAHNVEVYIERPDGSRLPVLVNFAALKDAQGKVTGAITSFIDITERKQAEQTLAESEGRFRRLVEGAPFGMYIVDSQFKIAQMNTRAQADAFKNVRPVIGRDFSDAMRILWPEDVAQQIIKIFRHTLDTGEPYYSKDFVNPRSDIEAVEGYEWELQRLTLPDRTIGVICYYYDSSELRLAEHALRESEERYRSLVSVITDVPWTTDPEGRFVTPQNAWAAYTGQSWEELRDFGWANALHPNDRESVKAIWERACQSKSLYESRGRLWHAPSQQFRHFVARATPLFNADGSVREWVGTCTDVHEPIQTEKSLRESEERFHMLADNMNQLAWTCDKLGNVTWYNQRWHDYTGLSFDEMKGWDWSKVQHPDHLDRVVRRVQRTAETGEPWEDTFPLRGKDGQYRWFLSRAVPIRDEQGNIVRWFGTNTDVTEQYAAEEALRQADRRKDEFLATLAHELRNPLAATGNAVQILLRPSSDPQTVRSAAEILGRQVAHIVRQVDDLLDVSRISRGKIELKKQPTELAGVVNQAVETIRPLCESLAQELTVTLPPQSVYVDGDPVRLVQVVGNLLNNACKFTNENGRIWLTLEQQGGQAVIRVRDAGIGIAADQLGRVFDMFTQLDTSLERSRSGLGLGLTLVKTLVEMHAGTVEAHSAGRGQGSEFVVRLPCIAAPLPAAAREPAGVKGGATIPLRVLVVDDNRDAANSLAMLLKLMGHQVEVAHDGLEAVARSVTYPADLILLDIGMPRLNGYEAARRIREQRGHAGLTLVALTGWGQEEDRRRSKEAGFDAHLVKPVDMAALTRLLVEPVVNQ